MREQTSFSIFINCLYSFAYFAFALFFSWLLDLEHDFELIQRKKRGNFLPLTNLVPFGPQ